MATAAPSATAAAAVCAATTSVCASDAVCGSASSSGSPSATSEAAPSATSSSASAALQKPLHLHILQLPPAILLTPNHLKDSPALPTLMLCDISYVSNN